jgi:arabinose-5-phosphate isomerase
LPLRRTFPIDSGMTLSLVSSEPAVRDAIIAQGRHTLMRSIEGLQAVCDTLDERFASAVNMMAAIKGRVVVTGMGKSGHIARKIAATLASTGTPAYFVHPAEASHGDMGMITEGDVLLMLSNSGETAELAAMIAYAKRFYIPMIAIVRRDKSMLVELADIAIVLPAVPEASVTGAPTTSTSMMLAYGDALAMALLEQHGFTREDFSNFHPGGKLGKGLMRVHELMHGIDALPIVPLHELMQDVLVVMTQKAFGCAVVVNADGTLAGIITDGDLRRHMGEGLLRRTAEEIMTQNPLTTRPNALAAEVLHILNMRSITSLIAVEDGKPVGLIHIHDCLRAGVA